MLHVTIVRLPSCSLNEPVNANPQTKVSAVARGSLLMVIVSALSYPIHMDVGVSISGCG